MFEASVRKPVVFAVKSNVWWSPFGPAYFGWRVHMSAFKSTHLSPNAAAERIASWMLSFSSVAATKNKGPHLLKKLSNQQRLFSAFLFYFIINSGYNGLVHMTWRHFIILSMNTNIYQKNERTRSVQLGQMYKESVFLSFRGVAVLTVSVPRMRYKHNWYFLFKH